MAETLLLLVNPLFWMLKPCETPYISRGEKKNVFFDDGSLILHDSMIQPLFFPEKSPFFDDGDINQPPAASSVFLAAAGRLLEGPTSASQRAELRDQRRSVLRGDNGYHLLYSKSNND